VLAAETETAVPTGTVPKIVAAKIADNTAFARFFNFISILLCFFTVIFVIIFYNYFI
jgi:hypothetical protein